MSVVLLLLVALTSADTILQSVSNLGSVTLELLAQLPQLQITGVAVSARSRVFVAVPRWQHAGGISLGQVVQSSNKEDVVLAYPDDAYNSYQHGAEANSLLNKFVAVQSVYIDDTDTMWVVDSGNPFMQGVLHNHAAAKLVQIDVATNRVLQTFPFHSPVIETHSYLNDVRVDSDKRFAYLTDSGANGALIVLNLQTGVSKRCLAGTEYTMADPTFQPVIENTPWKTYPSGDIPQVHADGIALSHDCRTLHWQVLSGNKLFSISTQRLIDWCNAEEGEEDLAGHVVRHGVTAMSDGMETDSDGRVYLTGLEKNGIIVCSPWNMPAACVTVVQHPQLQWPDSLAWSADRSALYITTSELHLAEWFGDGSDRRSGVYKIWRLKGTWMKANSKDEL